LKQYGLIKSALVALFHIRPGAKGYNVVITIDFFLSLCYNNYSKAKEVINLKYIFIIHRHNGKVDKYDFGKLFIECSIDKIKTIYAFYILKAKHQYSNITICYYEEKLRLLGKIKDRIQKRGN
jgi:hypothetical protein